ncbi:MAG: ATP-binding protein [Desulfobacterota bacterium]|nr:ATP-binding protein [Thermodesulfobacteriota bacterium]
MDHPKTVQTQPQDDLESLRRRLAEAEKALTESERRFQTLMENSPIGILIIQGGKIVYENRVEKRLPSPLTQFFQNGKLENIHPDDYEKVERGFRQILTGEVKSLDMDFRYYSGTQGGEDKDMIWVHCWASAIEYQGREALLVSKLDITRAKEMEHLLRIEDKMASLGRIASGIAHEIRSPLSGINIFLNNLETTLQEEQSGEKVKEILRKIRSASIKIEGVIRRVMDFAKPTEPRFVLIDLHQPIQEAIDLSAVALRRSGVTLHRSFAPSLPPCLADPHLFGQVILNLISNASEAMKGQDGARQIEIATSCREDRIVITLSDSGPGVPFHLRKKIFDPFFTTKDGSTGIGLSICQRIVNDHGGELSVSTSRWGGAEFRIELPVKRERRRT